MNNFNVEEIKSMWSAIFGDTREYIDMIIDGYFNKDMASIIMLDNIVASASVVIVYDFEYKIKEITGYYLCGLMTKPCYRGQGYMQKVIEDIERKAIINNASFTFLIPADERLRHYYQKLEYKNTCKRTKISLNFTSGYPFDSCIKNDNIINHVIGEEYYKVSYNNSKQIQMDNLSINHNINLKNILEYNENILLYLSHIASKRTNTNKSLSKEEIIDKEIDSYDGNFLCRNSELVDSDIIDKTDINYIKILHSHRQWYDVMVDHLREDANIYFSIKTGNAITKIFESKKSGNKKLKDKISSIIIITKNNIIYPISGDVSSMWRLIKESIVARKNENYSIYISDPEKSKEFQKIMNSDCPNGIYTTIDEEYYGMAKCFRNEIDESSIVMDMMFD